MIRDWQSFALGALIPCIAWFVAYDILPRIARRIAKRLHGTDYVIFDFAGLTRVLTREEASDLIRRIEGSLHKRSDNG